MSDAARKGLGEQAQEKLTPQSQKSTGQVIGENLTGAGDKVAAAVQPSSEKSATQKAGDSLRGSGDSAQKEGGGVLDSVSKTVTDTSNSFRYLVHGSSLFSLAARFIMVDLGNA
ncbi:heat shock protein 9/12-domain-containing protein [Cadophora sp. MPI-SDFR-AT-0126]|nr:heat shock protein 9/12-domain-containing protein [Leotiomycetes sp. MPI-SDFR-AT-0126]